ncbi:Retrovirus-related Pol polyprotein from transposon TNT 1-94 [Trichinella pseudospiralis]|uniref:Retrovirus-related Pol polyprotein from transposon TNT 1-94 n=2 Tax=Trichinella pseudospiralis TaxID=6337 RepID=A0A0V1DV95_TRIPS|nr:Retrovirus-related Pol polyprotein from transposon TNT 1-94 [Trichinella pseudospiralis]
MQAASVVVVGYFLSFIDNFSRKSFVYFLKHKNEALLMFKDFIANRGKANFKKSEIPETPQQNAVAEKMNQTLVEKARMMMIDANLSPDLWAEAVGTANCQRNRCPTRFLRKLTPEEAWSGLRITKEVASKSRRTDLRRWMLPSFFKISREIYN